MSTTDLRERVYQAIADLADQDGIATVSYARIADALGVKDSMVEKRVTELVKDGRIERVALGLGKRLPVLRVVSAPPPSGIDSVTRYVADRGSLTGDTRYVRISLPRVRCLEFPPCQ